MRRKSLIELTAVILTVVVFFCLFPTQRIKAYGEDGTKTVDGYEFVYDSAMGFYVADLNNGWGSAPYYLIDQGLVDKFGGTLPYYVLEGQNMSITTRFYLGEDITVSKGLTVPYHTTISIMMQGRKITFDPSDNNEVMWDGITNAPVSLDLYNSYDYSYVPYTNGQVYSPNGATLFTAGSEGYYTSSVTIRDVDLIGGYKSVYSDVRNSAVKLVGNGQFSAYFDRNGCVIRNFSAPYGGAFYVEGSKFELDGGGYTYGADLTLEKATVTDCYAYAGGAVYLQGQMRISGNYDYDSQTSDFKYGIKDCEARDRGGAICAEGKYSSIEADHGTVILGNCVENGLGGGIYIESDTDQMTYKLQITGCTLIGGNFNKYGGGDNDVYLNYKGGVYDCIYVEMSRVHASRIGVTGTGFDSGDTIIRGYYYHQSYEEDLNNAIFFENSEYKLLPVRKNSEGTAGYMIVVEGDGSDPVALKGYSLLTGGAGVGIKFHVYIPENEDIGSKGNDIWTANVSAVSDPLYVRGTNEQTLKLDKYERDGNFVTFTYYVDPTDMTVPLKFELYKGDILVDSMEGFTVRDYIDAVCKDYRKYDLRSCNPAVSLALYGAASQEYFGFRTDDLADKNLTEEMKNNTAFKDWEISNPIHDYTPNEGNMPYYVPSGDHVSFYGWIMSFSGEPSIKYYFKVTDPDDIDKIDISVSIYYDPDQISIYKTGGSYYCVKFSGLSMYQMYGTILFTVTYDGFEEAEIEFNSKPINYLHWISNDIGSTYSAQAHNLADAFILYSKKYYY